MSFLDKMKETVEGSKKSSISIPNDSVVKTLLCEIDYTKKGKESASIIGGIAVKFAFLGYYKKDNQGKDIYVPCIDYSDLEDITFPIDVKYDDGSWERPGLMSKPIYLSENVLRYKNYTVVQNIQATALLYASMIGLQLGSNMCEPFVHCLNSSGLCAQDSLNALEMGISSGFNDKFPIFHTVRHTYWEYDKADRLKGGGVREGARKQFHETLGARRVQNEDGTITWDKTVHEIPIELIPSNVAIKIYDALLKRNELKKAEKEALSPSTTAYSSTNSSSDFDTDPPF